MFSRFKGESKVTVGVHFHTKLSRCGHHMHKNGMYIQYVLNVLNDRFVGIFSKCSLNQSPIKTNVLNNAIHSF